MFRLNIFKFKIAILKYLNLRSKGKHCKHLQKFGPVAQLVRAVHS